MLRAIVLAALALNLAACRFERAPDPDESLAAFAAYERCLIGPPLEPGELLSQRLRSIELRQPQGWPERCQPLAEQSNRAAGGVEFRAATSSSNRPQDIKDEAWALVHERFEIPVGELPAGLAPAPDPVHAPPTPPPLLEFDFGLIRIEPAPAALGTLGALGAARFLIGEHRERLCELETRDGAWVARCHLLPNDKRERHLPPAESGSPLALLLDGVPHVLRDDAQLEPLSSRSSGIRFLSGRDQSLYWFEDLSREQLHSGYKLRVRSPAGETSFPLPMERSYRERLVVRGRAAFWTRGGTLVRAQLELESLAEQLAKPAEVGPFLAGYTIGPLCRAGEREVLMTSLARAKLRESTTRAVRLFTRPDPSAAWSFLDTEVEQKPSKTQLGIFTRRAPAAELRCDAHGIRLTNDSAGGLELTRCIDAECSEARVELPWLEGARAQRTAWRGEALLVVWSPIMNNRGQGLRMRLAPPEALADTPETLLLDNGPTRIDALELLELEHTTIVLALWEDRLHALWINDDGSFGPVELDHAD